MTFFLTKFRPLSGGSNGSHFSADWTRFAGELSLRVRGDSRKRGAARVTSERHAGDTWGDGERHHGKGIAKAATDSF